MLKKYQEIYIKEHGYEEECKKFTKNGKHDCEKCVEEFKKVQGKVAIACPTYPLYSDSVTKVLSYEDLFAVNSAEKNERDEKARAVRLEKEYEERKSAKENSPKVNLRKEKVEEQKSDEKFESAEENREIAEVVGENQSENAEDVESDGENLGGQIGASAAEKSESEIVEEKIAEKILSDFYFGEKNQKIFLFGESLSKLREYEESWEKFINGD